MCGRYLIDTDDDLFDTLPGKKGEILPGDAPCVYLRESRILPTVKTWGFPVSGSKLIINARSETSDVKPMFRDLLKTRRLLIPASYYYEYDREKAKHSLGIPGSRIYMAGLYSADRFVILTAPAAPGIQAIHDRMPVIFGHDTALEWLNPAYDPMSILERALNAEVLA